MTERYSNQARRILEPAYSPEEGVWFVDDGTTAKSLRALQAKLPDAVFEGYYPDGYKPERPTHKFPQEMSHRVVKIKYNSWVRTKPAEPAPAIPGNEELDAGAEFKPVTFLHRKARKAESSRRASKVWYDRHRAPQPRLPPVNWKEWGPKLAEMGQTMTHREIAEKIGCGLNAVIGRCHREKITVKASTDHHSRSKIERPRDLDHKA